MVNRGPEKDISVNGKSIQVILINIFCISINSKGNKVILCSIFPLILKLFRLFYAIKFQRIENPVIIFEINNVSGGRFTKHSHV